jgi:hypothetical protein
MTQSVRQWRSSHADPTSTTAGPRAGTGVLARRSVAAPSGYIRPPAGDAIDTAFRRGRPSADDRFRLRRSLAAGDRLGDDPHVRRQTPSGVSGFCCLTRPPTAALVLSTVSTASICRPGRMGGSIHRPKEDTMESIKLVDCAGRPRSPATLPGYHRGRPPRNKGLRYPPDPPTERRSAAVSRTASRCVRCEDPFLLASTAGS